MSILLRAIGEVVVNVLSQVYDMLPLHLQAVVKNFVFRFFLSCFLSMYCSGLPRTIVSTLVWNIVFNVNSIWDFFPMVIRYVIAAIIFHYLSAYLERQVRYFSRRLHGLLYNFVLSLILNYVVRATVSLFI
jgi:MFS superfamily sulfate permease-like transporter